MGSPTYTAPKADLHTKRYRKACNLKVKLNTKSIKETHSSYTRKLSGSQTDRHKNNLNLIWRIRHSYGIRISSPLVVFVVDKWSLGRGRRILIEGQLYPRWEIEGWTRRRPTRLHVSGQVRVSRCTCPLIAPSANCHRNSINLPMTITSFHRIGQFLHQSSS